MRDTGRIIDGSAVEKLSAAQKSGIDDGFRALVFAMRLGQKKYLETRTIGTLLYVQGLESRVDAELERWSASKDTNEQEEHTVN